MRPRPCYGDDMLEFILVHFRPNFRLVTRLGTPLSRSGVTVIVEAALISLRTFGDGRIGTPHLLILIF